MGNVTPLLKRSHRFAGFAVLKAPDVPSVLVELGFLSNPVDRKNLHSPAFRDRIAEGLARSVDNYFQGMQSAFRSEEHTSELQSLMRISYAVFCLKKKKHYLQIYNK